VSLRVLITTGLAAGATITGCSTEEEKKCENSKIYLKMQKLCYLVDKTSSGNLYQIFKYV
jgi:hypothetical protein